MPEDSNPLVSILKTLAGKGLGVLASIVRSQLGDVFPFLRENSEIMDALDEIAKTQSEISRQIKALGDSQVANFLGADVRHAMTKIDSSRQTFQSFVISYQHANHQLEQAKTSPAKSDQLARAQVDFHDTHDALVRWASDMTAADGLREHLNTIDSAMRPSSTTTSGDGFLIALMKQRISSGPDGIGTNPYDQIYREMQAEFAQLIQYQYVALGMLMMATRMQGMQTKSDEDQFLGQMTEQLNYINANVPVLVKVFGRMPSTGLAIKELTMQNVELCSYTQQDAHNKMFLGIGLHEAPKLIKKGKFVPGQDTKFSIAPVPHMPGHYQIWLTNHGRGSTIFQAWKKHIRGAWELAWNPRDRPDNWSPQPWRITPGGGEQSITIRNGANNPWAMRNRSVQLPNMTKLDFDYYTVSAGIVRDDTDHDTDLDIQITFHDEDIAAIGPAFP